MTITEPLFPITAQAAGNVTAAIEGQLQMMHEQGLIGPAQQGIAATLVKLAQVIDRETRGYAVAQASAELRAALESLPKPQAADLWSALVTVCQGLAAPAGEAPPAAYLTPPTPGAPHQAMAVAAVAALLGKPLMPWQYMAAKLITERTPDDTRWRYPTVIITVPRQSGKTTLLDALYTQRCVTRPGTQVWMTAQTGKDATARWKDLQRLVANSPLGNWTTARFSAGSSSLSFPMTEAAISPFAPTPTAIHGYTISDAAIDEGFAFDDETGAALLGAVNPAMATIEDAQLIIISTAGNPESTWLKNWVDKGRQATKEKNANIGYLEYSSQDGSIDFHPALGWTISREKLLEARESGLPPAEWKRAYLNNWVENISEPLCDPAWWDSTNNDRPPQPASGQLIAVSYEVAYDRSRATIVACWESDDGIAHQRIVAQGPGTGWLIEALDETLDTLGPAAVLVADDGGESRQITDALAKRGTPVRTLGARDFTAACSAWLGRLHDHTLDHPSYTRPDDSVRAGLLCAQTRTLGDGWAISRRHSTGPVDALIASIVALRVIDTAQIAPAPFIG